MFKKCTFMITLLFTVLLTCFSASFASPQMGGEKQSAKVYLANQEITFENVPFVLNGEIMVSARSFFEKVGAQVLTIESTGEVIAYRDNIFVKLRPNDKIAFVNGQSKTMPVHAVTVKGDLFISASFAAKTLEMSHTGDSTSNGIFINYRENILEYQQFGFRHFKRATLPNWGISFYVPEYWQKSEIDPNRYETDGLFESYALVAGYEPLGPQFTRQLYKDRLIEALIAEHGDAFHLVSNSTQKLGEYLSDVVAYEVKLTNETKHFILYVFYEQNIGYTLLGEYQKFDEFSDSRDIFDLIASTFSITKLTINEQLEHYTELGSFHNHGVSFRKPIYSNMPVNNQFAFAGFLENPENIKGFHVIVTKDGEESVFYVPVIDGGFNTRVFTPFGLGKHNVTVVLDRTLETQEETAQVDIPTSETESETESEEIEAPPFSEILDALVRDAQVMTVNPDSVDTIMKFSVLNISSDRIRYLLPSDYVNYDATELYNISNALTFRLTNQASKSRALYEWITENYIYSETLQEERIVTALELIDETRANSIELCLLYTGLLRSVDIPARIVKGTSIDVTEYWVEAYINGSWFVYDIVKGTRDKNTELEHFGLDQSIHYEDYAIVEYQNF